MINRHTSFTDLLYLHNGDTAKAARAANLPLPRSPIPPSPGNYWENKDIKDLMNRAHASASKNNPVVVIDSLGEYNPNQNKDWS